MRREGGRGAPARAGADAGRGFGSFAALQMNRDLGFTPQVYAIGTAIFFIGYTAFEVPSNMVLHRVGAPRWLARIMVTCASGGRRAPGD